MAESDVLFLRGVRSGSSLNFAKTVMQCLNAREPFVLLNAQTKANDISGVKITEILEPEGGFGWFDEGFSPSRADQLAQIAFTSGTTGTPKGIMLTHLCLSDTVDRLNSVMELDSSIREYVGVPVNYSFGMGRLRAVAAAGGRSYLPERGFDPVELRRMLTAGEINALSAVPTLLRIILQQPDILGEAGNALRWLEIGSQYLSGKEKEQVKSLFPFAKIVQHYGLTEASRSTFLDISATEGAALESVGRPVGKTEIKIAADGRICIRGPHVAQEALIEGRRSRLTDAEGWLVTNDMGRLDEGGYIHFMGRQDDLINCGGVKIVPDALEERIRQRVQNPALKIAVARVPDPLRGDGIMVACENADPDSLENLKAVAAALLSEQGLTIGSALHVQSFDRLPVTDTGKVQRRLLAEAFSPVASEPPEGDLDDANTVIEAFRAILPSKRVTPESTFVELGGDSLNFVRLSILLEERFSNVPTGWETIPVSELEASLTPIAAGKGRNGFFSLREMSSEILLRALATLMVVAGHVWLAEFGAGIDILLLLTGVTLARVHRARLVTSRRWTLLGDVALKIVLPYYAILLLYSVYHRYYVTMDLLMVSNFYGRKGMLLTPFWFIEGYWQTILLVVVLSSFPLVSRAMKLKPLEFGLAALVASVALKIGAMAIFHHQDLVNRTPDQFLYLVAAGWCIYFADNWRIKLGLVVFALFAAVAQSTALSAIWQGFGGETRGPFFAIAVCILIWWPKLRIPNFLYVSLFEISFASFSIYMSHSLVIAKLRFIEPVALFVILVVIGILVSMTMSFARKTLYQVANSMRKGHRSTL